MAMARAKAIPAPTKPIRFTNTTSNTTLELFLSITL